MQGFSIIILNWNGLHHLKRFLPSVTLTTYPDYEIIVADNASDDTSVEWVEANYPNVRTVVLDKNYGYCGGNNRAAEFARHNTLVFLNNDVAVQPEWLDSIARLMAGNPLIDAVQPRIRSYSNPERFEYAGAAGGFLDRFGYPFCRGRIFDTVETDIEQYNKATPIFWATGAALVIRKSAFQSLGGFEESFEFHMEEIDLCWRLQHKGRQVWYCPSSIVYHLGGGSLPAAHPRKTYYNFRNNLLMLIRNHPSKGFLRCMAMRVLMDSIAGVRFLTQREWTFFAAVVSAYGSALNRLPQALEFRFNASKNLPIAVPLHPFSIVWEYFVRKKSHYRDLPVDNTERLPSNR